jgi:glycerophosphoryl diester phosphodiesterase
MRFITALTAAALMVAATLSGTAALLASGSSPQAQAPAVPVREPWLIAHRGASAYAPENTVPAFTLAAGQGAAFVEFDLQLTKDRQIVCLHDESLERTTDVEDRFPDRARTVTGTGGKTTKRWMLADFTLAELKTLDAGSWFGPAFKGTRIPTLAETIEALRGKSGLFIELKAPEKYVGIEQMVLDVLKAKGLAEPGADPRTPVLLQTFTASSLKILADTGTRLPRHFLVGAKDAGEWLTVEGLARLKTFATGLSPEKSVVRDQREGIARARQAGLPITPYTFRSSAVTGFPDVTAEMAYYLDTLGVDGVITDNPDRMPGRSASGPSK